MTPTESPGAMVPALVITPVIVPVPVSQAFVLMNRPLEKEWVPPQTNDPIQNYGGKECGGSMAEVFWRSCNIPFAKMAVQLGPELMVDGVRAWGVGERIPIDLPAPAASNFENAGNDPIDFAQNLPLLAIAGFGQANEIGRAHV